MLLVVLLVRGVAVEVKSQRARGGFM